MSEPVYQLTRDGYRDVLSWVRFQVQECELIHPDLLPTTCGDLNHYTAMLVVLMIPADVVTE